MARILVVDDDSHIRQLVGAILKNEGFEMRYAEDGEEALSILETASVDLMILDIMMPKLDGWELAEKVRAYYDFPLLMLTAKGETKEKVKGFQLGTDDYVVKPFEPAELVVRVKALLKRYNISASNTVKAGKLSINKNTHNVTAGKLVYSLPLKEFELLFLLASYPGKTFSREQLIQQVWGPDYEGDDRTVDVHIKRLRARFTEEEAGIKISTVWGLGYRFESGT
ncbi:response regulator transcription factor [Fictibacillus sp. KU28468]|uniref:response regulator transcription factor n=1 Tax=Fictibacillus sp. KU28468 TaxID=2991053 RepID=UPI00223E1B6B|nr:response regulator transcription factor [Fictibacillus sp. KU28468]UZJ77882.1 response regulator transcription factor [Fictibacillus sp. KU28468]